jgi:hypothetical protein
VSQQTPSFNNWNNADAQYSNTSQPTLGPSPIFRSSKDALLSGYRTAVDTQYPDGYLGTMSANRRQDKVLGTLSRMNARQYSRGVHKGERINTGDYFWPEEFGKYTAIEMQAKGLKFAPVGAEPVRLTNDGKVGPRGIPSMQGEQQPVQMSPQQLSRLRELAPRWR